MDSIYCRISMKISLATFRSNSKSIKKQFEFVSIENVQLTLLFADSTDHFHSVDPEAQLQLEINTVDERNS